MFTNGETLSISTSFDFLASFKAAAIFPGVEPRVPFIVYEKVINH